MIFTQKKILVPFGMSLLLGKSIFEGRDRSVRSKKGEMYMKQSWPSFEELKRLAEQAPDQLEEFRKREVAALIAKAPEHSRRRLRGIQFQIDCQRSLHKTPIGSCIAISKMMQESLTRLNSALNRHSSEHKPSHSNTFDNVVPFAG